MSNLQLFTEPGGDGGGSGEGDGAGTGGDPGSNSNTTMSFDDFLKLEGNQSEFDRRVQKAVNTAVTNAQTKWKALTDDKVSEAEKLAQMTNEEKAKGENPRVTKAMLDSYIDSEEVDIDELMEKTKDFLSKTNATKKAVKEILKEYEEQMAKKRQAQEQ